MTDQKPLTEGQLVQTEAFLNGPLGQKGVVDADTARILVAEVRRLQAELAHQAEIVTEFRLPAIEPSYTPLIVRRDPAYDPTGWAVLHDPGDSSVRRIWTPEGWEMAWASTHQEVYCWADAASALAQARRAQGEYEENDGGMDGAGRSAASYREGAQR